nr:hypothetical protein [Tanacetum cinerariifolium]
MGSKEEAKRAKRQGIILEKEQVKKQKLSEEAPEFKTPTEEVSEDKIKAMMQLVPIEDVYVQALQVKYPIIKWKLDREDLNQLWALVKEYLSIRPASNDKEMELWVELKRMYEPDPEEAEFADELALITYPSDYDDNLTCDIESDIKEIEFLLYQGEDSNFKDSIDQYVLANCDDLFVDPILKMFTDEQPPDYSFPSRFDVYPDDFSEIESDATFDDDLLDSEGEKIKEAELLIDQLDLPYDILSEYDSFNSYDFSRDDVLPSPDNEDKDSDPPFHELLVFIEVPNSMRLLPFSSENEEKVFKPGINTFKKVHCFLSELSHLSFHVFKVNLIFISLMKIFHVQSEKNTPPLDVLLFHFIPLDSLKYGGNVVQLT